MDREHFTPGFPGEIVNIDTARGKDIAFVPHSLPPNWKFPDRLWPLLANARQQVGIVEGIGRNLPNPAILLRPLADREAIRSSRLEGTYASPKELLLFELEPREAKSEHDEVNSQVEVFNYRKSLSYGTQSELPISLRLIRELHRILLTGVRGKDRSPGNFRTIQVAIGSTGRFIPPPPDKLMECLSPMEQYIHAESRSFDPIVDCFLIHYQFETIHPFTDGNGRVGRLLLAIMLQQRCGLSKPWLYMSEFFERYRDEYIGNLFNVSAKGDWESWLEFCLNGLLVQATETVARCERLLAIRAEYGQRISSAGGSVRLNQIVDQIFHSPFVRIADLPALLGVTYPTAKADIERLVNANVLEVLPEVYPKTYYAPEVFEVSYDSLDDK